MIISHLRHIDLVIISTARTNKITRRNARKYEGTISLALYLLGTVSVSKNTHRPWDQKSTKGNCNVDPPEVLPSFLEYHWSYICFSHSLIQAAHTSFQTLDSRDEIGGCGAKVQEFNTTGSRNLTLRTSKIFSHFNTKKMCNFYQLLTSNLLILIS